MQLRTGKIINRPSNFDSGSSVAFHKIPHDFGCGSSSAIRNISTEREHVTSSQMVPEFENMKAQNQSLTALIIANNSRIELLEKENEKLRKDIEQSEQKKPPSKQITELKRLVDEANTNGNKISKMLEVYKYLYKEYNHFLENKNTIPGYTIFIKTVIDKCKELKNDIHEKIKHEDETFIRIAYELYYYMDVVLNRLQS